MESWHASISIRVFFFLTFFRPTAYKRVKFWVVYVDLTYPTPLFPYFTLLFTCESLAHVSSHFLRHAYATISLAGTSDGSKPSLIAVSRSLGHAGLASTQTYLHSLDEKSPSEFISLVDDDEDDEDMQEEQASSSSTDAAASGKRKSQDSAGASAKPKKRKTNPAKKNSRLLAFLRN